MSRAHLHLYDLKITSFSFCYGLPEEEVHVKGSQFEREPAVAPPLPSGPHLQGSHVLQQVVAGYLWSHLLVGKAKIHEHTRKTVFSSFTRMQENNKEDTGRVVMQITLSRHYEKFFKSCPLQMHSPPYSGTRPSPWVTAEWT